MTNTMGRFILLRHGLDKYEEEMRFYPFWGLPPFLFFSVNDGFLPEEGNY